MKGSSEQQSVVRDWDRIQKIGLLPAAKTPKGYLFEVSMGESLARRALLEAGKVVPSSADIQGLNYVMFRSVHPWVGTFRKAGQEVSAGDLVCSLSKDIPRDLRQITSEMNNNSLTGSKRYKAEVIAYYHAGLIAVHPFLDGNGRLSRILANYQSTRLLNQRLDLSGVERGAYINALRAAHNNGDLSPLSKLILDAGVAIKELKHPLASLQELRAKEHFLVAQRKRLGFVGSDTDAIYGLGGFPSALSKEEAKKKALTLSKGRPDRVEGLVERLLEDDRALVKKRGLVQNQLISIREQMTSISLAGEPSKNLGLSRGKKK